MPQPMFHTGTKKSFLSWLYTQPMEKVWKIKNSYSCPIAEYLSFINPGFKFTTSQATIRVLNTTYIIITPKWVKKVLNSFDDHEKFELTTIGIILFLSEPNSRQS